jgi:putative hemolysin
MIMLCVALLVLAALYLGTVGAAFSSLMRLSLRLVAERTGQASRLGAYLDDPVQLFLPVRAALGGVHVLLTLCVVHLVGFDAPDRIAVVILSTLAMVLLFEHAFPFLIVRRDPVRVLEVLMPSFDLAARAMSPFLSPLRALVSSRLDKPSNATGEASEAEQQEATAAYFEAGEQEGLIEGDDRRLLQSIVDFGDTLVREAMTPRPDIVAIKASVTLSELQAFFREQEYSRIPVYTDALDNIVGFVFIKDLMRLPVGQRGDTLVADLQPSLVRPAEFVPETKKVSDLLREFQRKQLQIAIVVDEYGGTAGLVTLEDLLEEIVGEIRDEYDVETESVVDEPGGSYLVTGKADVHTVAERLGLEIEPEGFETFGGYILARIGRVPAMGEQFEVEGLHIEVLDAERRRVHRLRVRRLSSTGVAGSPASAREDGSA